MSRNTLNEQDKLKAAYALNLCTVSVSQIIDFNDANVLDQEYEAILNNLNLEQMPKDAALLDILKQLLDVITFFRIQEREKEFIDREYQEEIKNAIWSSVPNLSMFVTGGNPAAIAVSIATQIGIGYMNYRKAKTQAKLSKDKQMWRLEMNAIEQFNGLRRELFDTAWRLADAYEFPDEYRLTERQIHQYNTILMDPDDLRKFERLQSIEEFFKAYPPFWYFIGNAANVIYQNRQLRISDEVREFYKNEAARYFSVFWNVNDLNLLRENQLAASCALENIDLLDPESDAEKIKGLIEKAERYSGYSNDVLQLCAVASMKIGDAEHAARLLRRLFNEEYNTVVNAQLLSNIYVRTYIESTSEETRKLIRNRYDSMALRINHRYLFPMPKTDRIGRNYQALRKEYFQIQKQVLEDKFTMALEEFQELYARKFHRIIPPAVPADNLTDYYFEETERARALRIRDVRRVLIGPYADEYINRIKDTQFAFAYLDLFNDMIRAICEFEFIESVRIAQNLSVDIGEHIVKNRDQMITIQKKLEAGKNHFTIEDYKCLEKLTFSEFTDDFFKEVKELFNQYIQDVSTMTELSSIESDLKDFCMKNGIKEPEALFEPEDSDNEMLMQQEIYLGENWLGDYAIQMKERADNVQKMQTFVEQYKDAVILRGNNTVFHVSEKDIQKYFEGNRLGTEFHQIRQRTIGILDDRTKNDIDLILTTQGVIVLIKGSGRKNLVEYRKIQKSVKGDSLTIGAAKYSNENVNEVTLYELFMLLADCADAVHYSESHDVRKGMYVLPGIFRQNK